jgi:hypothetical protein
MNDELDRVWNGEVVPSRNLPRGIEENQEKTSDNTVDVSALQNHVSPPYNVTDRLTCSVL